MNSTWEYRLLSYILHISSRIHRLKERFAKQGGVTVGVTIVVFEIWLRFLSLPTYFLVNRDAVVTAFADRPDDVVRYQARTDYLSKKIHGSIHT